MSGRIFLLLAALLQLGGCQHPVGNAKLNPDEEKAAAFVGTSEEELLASTEKQTFINWAYESNITDANEKVKLDYQKVADALTLRIGKEAQKIKLDNIQDKDLLRKLKKLALIGTSALPEDKLSRYNVITNEMAKIYSTAKVPSYKDKTKLLNLEPELTEALAKSRDPKELEYYWTQWRAVTGAKFRKLFAEYVELTNEAARLNGYKDGTEMKVEDFESATFVEEMATTWSGLKPLYEQLHAYVRNKLLGRFGESVIDPEGPIPAHLLGNMWAQSWSNLNDILRPYPEKPDVDVTGEMVKQGWTPKKMFEKADEFFQSMGLDPMPKEFWEGSIIEKPADGRELTCHASAWDFYNGKDFRIKQCTKVDQEDFVTVNHEMGHIQYQMAYRNQSFLYRDGANTGFHEGVADILSIAVGTAGYYQKLGLLSKDVDIKDYETNINILFNMALQRLVFMPFGYLVDKYRWDLFSGLADKSDMNCHWVKLRLDIQGVAPPNQRNEEELDAGAKYHIAANVGYVRYFTAHIYEFQFYRALCLVSGQFVPNDPDKPLHRCNFFGSKAAGDKLSSMLRLGASKPWKEAIEVMTGKPEMSTDAYREYFQPLEDWLKKENARNGVKAGWRVKDYGQFCNSSGNSAAAFVKAGSNFLALVLVAASVTAWLMS